MTRRSQGSKTRRESLLRSLERSGGGGLTIYAAKQAATRLGGTPVECTITGRCRTFIFDYPGSYLVEAADHQIVYSNDSLQAAIVSDLPAYYEQIAAETLHYSIDVSLRAAVHSTYEKAIEEAKQRTQPEVPLFLVIEECVEVPPMVLNSGECFTIDECQDGKAFIEGGREGEKTLAAIKAGDGSWPDFHADMHPINVVLTAVKVEQNFIHHIEKLYSCSCFVSREGQAVHTISPTVGVGRLQTMSRLKSRDIREKADRIESMLQAMMLDSEPVASELFDSMVLDKTEDDGYFRLWYLRLWQAVDDAARHLGYPQLFNRPEMIAGKRTPKELKDYRRKIAHWETGRIEFSQLNDLQHTAMELMRRKYLPTQRGESDRSE